MDRKSPFPPIRRRWLERKFEYRSDPGEVDVRWATLKTRGTAVLPIAVLRPALRTPDGNVRVRIEEMPHYSWIRDSVRGNDDARSRHAYLEYVRRWIEEDVGSPYSPEARLAHFERLVRDFLTGNRPVSSLFVVSAPPKRRHRVGAVIAKLYDGVHRAALARALGEETIRSLIV